tara:strand:+ start:461 stop:610 length:150 start_codon:yes stop_codon:yes gene_type:complete
MFLLLSLYIASLGCAVAVPYFRYKYAPNRKDPVKFINTQAVLKYIPMLK